MIIGYFTGAKSRHRGLAPLFVTRPPGLNGNIRETQSMQNASENMCRLDGCMLLSLLKSALVYLQTLVKVLMHLVEHSTLCNA